MTRYSLLLALALWISQAGAQEFSYGIKAGLSFSNILGEKETDANGTALESGGFVTGFHAGVIFNIGLVEDKFGVSPELLYSLKGGKYRYEGEGYLPLSTSNGTLEELGLRRDVVSVSHSYIDIPVLIFYRPIENLKFSAGPNIAFLAGSTGSGETQFTWSDLANQEQTAILALDYNYYRDEPGEAAAETTETMEVDAGFTTVEHPSAIGAYYFDTEDRGSFFKALDVGLNFDVTGFLTPGISLTARVNYGLLDISNNKHDFSKQAPLSTVPRSDKDSNLSLQVALGFNF